MSDERLKKSADVRESREATDRAVVENRTVSDDERVEMFRQQFHQSALPDLPKISGWHSCWLTTSNPRDSIPARMRLGYQPIKPEDIPGWEVTSIKTGEWAGFIGVNEMIAFKLPLELYQRYMQEAHHDAPLREEEKLVSSAEFMAQQARTQGAALIMGDGNKEMGVDRKARFELA